MRKKISRHKAVRREQIEGWSKHCGLERNSEVFSFSRDGDSNQIFNLSANGGHFIYSGCSAPKILSPIIRDCGNSSPSLLTPLANVTRLPKSKGFQVVQLKSQPIVG